MQTGGTFRLVVCNNVNIKSFLMSDQ